jgi:hypothetical protein
MACNNLLMSNWGSQSFAQILMITDFGIGLGTNSIKHLINTIPTEGQPLPFPMQCKLSILGIGNAEDTGFKYGKITHFSALFVHYIFISSSIQE